MNPAVATACPAPDRLLAFASGQLSDDQSASVEDHIDSCTECRAALSNAARGDVPPKFGRYRIDTVLGSGGMGIVYRAWDPQLARAVAIKVVKRAADDATGRARLVREAQSLARLSHPNVCHVYDVGTDGDEVWVAMELIDGASLRDWAHSRPLGSPDVLNALLGAAEGIAAAHAAGIIHRDVKPENVLVTRDGRAIVTDFGLARGGEVIDPKATTITNEPLVTATGAIAGTPAYIAPEQLTGDPIDHRVDQFAWSVMAWELLAGSRPFPIIFALRVDAVRAGVTPPPAMDRAIAAVLVRGLQVVPGDRFESMRDLIEALRAPARRRRRRTPIALAAVALAAGGGVLAWQQLAPTAAATAPAAIVPHVIATTMPPPPPKPAAIATPAPVTQPVTTLPVHKAPPKLAVTAPVHPAAMVSPDAGSPPPAEHIVADDNPSISVATPRTRPFRRANALASMLDFCVIPYDPAHPDPTQRGTVVDWGKVTSAAVERGQFNGDPVAESILTIAGHRATYRIDADINLLGTIPSNVGDEVALCADRQVSNLYNFPGGATLPVIAALPLHGEPQLADLAKRRALHIRDIELAAQGSSGRISLATDRTYFLRTQIKKQDGDLYAMDRWWLRVPPGTPGADAIASGKSVWIVVDKPELVSAPDGGRPRFVMHAVEAVPEIFP